MFKKLMKLHFVGVGGSGMSGIAEVLLNLGYPVSGSDKKASDVTERLKRLGAKIFEGHAAAQVEGADAVVISNAVPETNPEVLEARRRKIPVIPRAEMLNELMRLKYGICVAGTHGKTTTSSMTGLVLAEGGLDPTLVIGGVLDALGGSNTLMGKGDYFVVEACEAYGSFLHLTPSVCVVTNIDNDHLDHYLNMDNLRDAFVKFVNSMPFYGFALVCGDDPEVQRIMPRLTRRIVSYGFGDKNDIYARVERQAGLTTSFKVYRGGQELGLAEVSLPGRHNILNALAAIGVGLELGLDFASCQRGLQRFTGVRRRFQVKGEAGGVMVVDDYAHHPTEVEATLEAARDALKGKAGRLVVAFQPHLYSRTQLLYRDFARVLGSADEIYLAGIYPARETPIPGVSSQLIYDLLQEAGKSVHYHFDPTEMKGKLLAALQPGDLFMTMGAGSLDKLGEEVLADLKARPA